MIRIGILLKTNSCNRYLRDTVAALSESSTCRIVLLVNDESASPPQGIFGRFRASVVGRGVRRSLQLGVFKSVAAVERKLLSRLSADVRDHDDLFDITSLADEVVDIRPQFSRSRLYVEYGQSEIDLIQSLDLDLIVRGDAPGILRGQILGASSQGILSFHHGDNRWNRGGPPGFWEVYFRKPSSGFVLQILTEELDGGRVVFRGAVPTRRTYAENVSKLYAESYPYLAQILLDFADTGTLPDSEPRLPFDGRLLVAPTIPKTLGYVVRTLSLFVRTVASRLVLRRRRRWSVAFIRRDWREASLRRGVIVDNPPGRFFADPFVIERAGRTVCFVEDYSFDLGRGHITAIELTGESDYEVLGPVLTEPFHTSFPFVFEYEGEVYMVPETGSLDSVRLYRCVSFPMHWQFERELVCGPGLSDAMVFAVGDRWWLLATAAVRAGGDANAKLVAFHSSDPTSSDWAPHMGNPLVVDSTTARNAGLLEAGSAAPIRCRQAHGFNAYGTGISLARMSSLTPTEFAENEIGRVNPDFFPGLDGTHHLHSNGTFTVYDFVRRESRR